MFVLLSFFFWPLCCLFFFELQILITPLISSNSVYTPAPRRGRGYTVLPLSVCPSFRSSKIFFVAFFSATIDDTNLIFGHKLHIGTPYRGEAFLNPSDSYFLFADFVDFYTNWTYMLIFRRIFLSKYWWQKSDISSHASYRYPILWEAFFDPSDSYFLFADLVGLNTHLTYIQPSGSPPNFNTCVPSCLADLILLDMY